MVYKGQLMRLVSNGKKLWSRPNHALAALTNAFSTAAYSQFNYRPYKHADEPSGDDEKAWMEAFKAWRKDNIQIVRLEDWLKEQHARNTSTIGNQDDSKTAG